MDPWHAPAHQRISLRGKDRSTASRSFASCTSTTIEFKCDGNMHMSTASMKPFKLSTGIIIGLNSGSPSMYSITTYGVAKISQDQCSLPCFVLHQPGRGYPGSGKGAQRKSGTASSQRSARYVKYHYDEVLRRQYG